MLGRMQMRNRILCQYRNIVGVDKLRNSMVHLRVNVVGASGKNDSPIAGAVQKFNGFLTLLFHVLAAC